MLDKVSARTTWVESEVNRSSEPVTLEQGRYLIGELLGSGSFGSVYRGVDSITGEAVAIKVFFEEGANAKQQIDREAAILRLLKAPGVVAFQRSGVHSGTLYIVTEMVEGQAFSGLSPSWQASGHHLTGVAEAVARVHEFGLTHGDIKPANLMIRDTGPVVVLDFGLAASIRTHEREGSVSGSPLYMAPETLDGVCASVSRDIYAFGLVAAEVLVGCIPDPTDDLVIRLQHRARESPLAKIPQSAWPTDLPEEVCSLVRRCTAPKPEHRPSSMAAVATTLARNLHDPLLAEAFSRVTDAKNQDELRCLFSGPDKIFHLREDAAMELGRRSNGTIEDLRVELGTWQRSGIVRAHNDRFLIRASQLDALRSNVVPVRPWAPSRARTTVEPALVHLLDGDLHAAVDACLHRCEQWQSQGRSALAWATALEAVELANRLDDSELKDRVLQTLATVSFRAMNPRWLRTVAHLGGEQDPWPCLKLAAQSAERGGLDVERRMSELHASLPCWLQPWWLIAREYALRAAPIDAHDTEIKRLIDQAPEDDLLLSARTIAWRGQLLFRRQRFAEAAILLEQAKHRSDDFALRLSLAVNAAIAHLESGDLRQVDITVDEALDSLAGRRYAPHEAYLLYLRQAASYRRRNFESPDPELADAMEHVPIPHIRGSFFLNSAAREWRSMRREETIRYAQSSRRAWEDAGSEDGLLLAYALLHNVAAKDVPDVRDLLDKAASTTLPLLQLQVLALIGQRPGHAATITRAISNVQALVGIDWNMPREVLSPSEAVLRLQSG